MVTEYNDAMLPMVLQALEKLNAHLSAAVVSNDHEFLGKVRSVSICMPHTTAFICTAVALVSVTATDMKGDKQLELERAGSLFGFAVGLSLVG